jgi:hypothetical protein
MSVIVSNNRIVTKSDRIIVSMDMTWQSKITNWLTGGDAYVTKSGTKVLTWTDKVNGNVWLDINGGNVTHTSGNNYLSFYAGGLYLANSWTNNKEVYMVYNKTATAQYSWPIGATVDQNAFIRSVNDTPFTVNVGAGGTPSYYKRDIVLNQKRVMDIGWTAGAGAFLIGRNYSGWPINAKVYEILFFSSQLNISQRDGLNMYMKTIHPDITN